MVIPNQRYTRICIWADYTQSAAGFAAEREDPVVLQQYTTLQCCPVGQSKVLAALDSRVGDRVIFAALFPQNSKEEPCSKQAHSAAGDVLF